MAQEILAHYQSYYRLSYSYLKNKEDAMDAVQESAYKAMVKCGHLKNPDAVSSWVYRIVVNTSLELLRRRAKRPLVLSEQTARWCSCLINTRRRRAIWAWWSSPFPFPISKTWQQIIPRFWRRNA